MLTGRGGRKRSSAQGAPDSPARGHAAARPCYGQYEQQSGRHHGPLDEFSGVRYIHGVNSASGGWETWSWDESLFAGAAGYYEQGRLPYAPGLADAFARSLALDGRGRLLDVGCGPGTVTLRLAPLFEAVVGLDPDAEMLACASRATAGRGVGNVTWVRQRAEALPAGLGSFRVVTFAASLHWMDRPRVASAVATMLDPGGAVVQVDAPGYRIDELSAETRLSLGAVLSSPPRQHPAYLAAARLIRRLGPGDRDLYPYGGADAGEPVDLPVPERGQQQADVHQRHQHQQRPGVGSQEPAVAAGRICALGSIGVRPNAKTRRADPGRQDGCRGAGRLAVRGRSLRRSSRRVPRAGCRIP